MGETCNYIHCLKCENKTSSKNIINTIAKNGRPMIKATCVDCGSKKTTFIKKENVVITKVKTNLREEIANELHKPLRRNFQRRKVLTNSIDDLWQTDLVEMIPYSKTNKDYKYLLNVIDVFSKYAWCIPIKNKTAKSTSIAFKSILKQGRTPINLQTDHGLEFYNKDFQTLMKEYNLNHYSTYTEKKACVIERFNRTLKDKMWKQFTINGNNKWLDMFNMLVDTYNNTKHRTINMTPNAASKKENEEKLRPLFQETIPNYKPKYKIGDKVRVSKYKTIFGQMRCLQLLK